MGFERLRFFNFRNLKDRELALRARARSSSSGENGQGKTNLLEAVHLLCLGSSFREKRESALARDPSPRRRAFPRRYSQRRGGARRPCRLQLAAGPAEGAPRERQGARGPPRAPLRGALHRASCSRTWISSPGLPRTGAGSSTRPSSSPTSPSSTPCATTARCSKSRNLCLRENRDDLLDVYDAQLAGLGLALQARRAALVREFDGVFSPLFREITGSEQERADPLSPLLGRALHHGRRHGAPRRPQGAGPAAGTTTSGPHRDACSYVAGGQGLLATSPPRGSFVSARSPSAWPRPGSLPQRTGRKPVLLLDDVLLELDPGAQEGLPLPLSPLRAGLLHLSPRRELAVLPDARYAWCSRSQRETFVQ